MFEQLFVQLLLVLWQIIVWLGYLMGFLFAFWVLKILVLIASRQPPKEIIVEETTKKEEKTSPLPNNKASKKVKGINFSKLPPIPPKNQQRAIENLEDKRPLIQKFWEQIGKGEDRDK